MNGHTRFRFPQLCTLAQLLTVKLGYLPLIHVRVTRAARISTRYGMSMPSAQPGVLENVGTFKRGRACARLASRHSEQRRS
jgi:hypothetical protein